MDSVAHPESGLSKATWRDDDLDAMSWNLVQIHALAVTDDEGPPDGLTPDEYLELDDVDDTAPSASELHFDLDYIVRRIKTPGPGPLVGVDYWVAPATLTFDCVTGLSGELRSAWLPLEMRNLHRLGHVGPHHGTRWHLEGRKFELRFQAWGFVLHLRQPPHYGRRVLRMAERGGISFEARPFA
jgi:hypothetical protein